MSCIVGVVQNGEVWMGADGAVSFGETRVRMKNRKMFREKFAGGEMLIGISGAPRVAQIMEYSFTFPDASGYDDPMDYLCADFVPALAAKLEEFKRWAPDKADAGEPKIVSSSHLLIAFQASLFLLDSELAVYEIERGYEAIGSGCEVATGYLRAVSDWREPSSDSLEAERMVRGALYAAAEFQRGVDGPFHVEKL